MNGMRGQEALRDCVGRRAARTLTLVLVLAAVGCADEAPTAAELGRTSSVRAAQKAAPEAPEAVTRRATPWQRMTRSELVAKVQEANGVVFIGFKDAQASAGVDEQGRALVSRAKAAEAKARVRQLDATAEITYESADLPMVVARISPQRLEALLDDPTVEYVEPIFPGRWTSQTIPWNATRENAPAAWSSSTGAGAKVLIADTGAPLGHPDIAPAVVHACDGSNGWDTYGHGTQVASVVSAVNNSVLGIGAAYGAALWSVKVGDEHPFVADVVCAVEYGRLNHVDVINLSLQSDPYTALTDAINAAVQQGTVVVASAGNDYGDPVNYPARLPAVIAVASTGVNNEWSAFSNVGPEVFLAAPGFAVDAACLGGGQCWAYGTSFAAPHVVAAVAILRGIDSTISVADIKLKLSQGATDLGPSGRDNWFGHGLLNITGAIAVVPPPPPPPPAMTATIVGNSQIAAYTGCVWSAVVEHGTPPYSYEWRLTKVALGTGETVWYANAGSNFTLNLTVTDAQQHTASAALPVVMNPNYWCA